MTAQELYALNQRIAEALGYRFEEFDREGSRFKVTIHMPEGRSFRSLLGDQMTSFRFREPDDVPLWESVVGEHMGLRNWAGDTDAALELARSEDVIGVDINQAGGEVVALMRGDTSRVASYQIAGEVIWSVGRLPRSASGYGDTYAEAICRAWLAWKGE